MVEFLLAHPLWLPGFTWSFSHPVGLSWGVLECTIMYIVVLYMYIDVLGMTVTTRGGG